MTGQAHSAKEVVLACRALRASLIHLRELLGGEHKSATACERFAQNLLGEEDARHTTPAEITKTLGVAPLLPKIQAILGERTMQLQEIFSVLLASKHQHRSGNLLGDLRREVGRHCNDQGRQLFVRVRHGWYRNRRRDEPAARDNRANKVEFLQSLYDAMGTDTVDSRELSVRLVQSGVRPERSDRSKINSCLSHHVNGGMRCFIRVGTGRFKRRPGARPEVELSRLIQVNAVETILGNGPLSLQEIRTALNARWPNKNFSVTFVRLLLADNCDNKGYRKFQRVRRGVFQLQPQDLLEQILRVAQSGVIISPQQVQSHLRDLGYHFSLNQVQDAMASNAGFGLPLKRIRYGKYTRNSP